MNNVVYLKLTQFCRFQGLWNKDHSEARVICFNNRETDPVECDRSSRRKHWEQSVIQRAEAKTASALDRRDLGDASQAVDVTRYEVPIKAIAKTHRPLHMESSTWMDGIKSTSCPCLFRCFERHRPSIESGDGQAGAVDRNAVPETDLLPFGRTG